MKLHLPKGLRAALLAVLTASAALTTTVQAGPCEYKDLNFVKDEDWASYDNENSIILKNNSACEGYALTYMPNANKQDWVLTIDGYNLSPVVVEDEALGVSLICTTGDHTDPETGKVTLNGANALSLLIDPTGDMRLVTTGEDQEVLRNNVFLGNVGRDWRKDVTDPEVSVRLILSWDADGGQPRALKDGTYGALTLVGAYILSNEDDHAILGKIESHYTGQVIIDNYDMPKNLFGWTETDRPLYSLAGDDSQVKLTLRSEGLGRVDSWVPNAAWVVTGPTSIAGLQNGQYADQYSDYRDGTGLGSITVRDPDTDESRTVTDKIIFRGLKGVLVLDTDLTNKEGEYELYNTNPISFDIDPTSKQPEAVAGFAATEGNTLRVDIDVMEETALSEEACGLSIAGTGTTILEIDNTGFVRYGDLAGEKDAYKGNTGDLKAYLENRNIKTDDLRFEEVRMTGDDQTVYSFALRDKAADRSITFASPDRNGDGAPDLYASNIILAPKGNGDITINLLTSQLHTESKVTMVDQSFREKHTETYRDPVLVPQLLYQTDPTDPNVSSATPKYDLKGRPLYFTDEDGKIQVAYERDRNGNYIELGANDPKTYTATDIHGNTYEVELKFKPIMTAQVTPIPVFDTEGNIIEVKKDGDGKVLTEIVYQDEEKTREFELWAGGNNDHTYIEKHVGETYSPVAQPLADHLVANPINGTNMVLKLYSSAIDASNSVGGHFKNDVAGGNIIIEGRKTINGLNDIDYVVPMKGILSTMTVSSLEAKGDIDIDANVIVNGDITAGADVILRSGTTITNNLTVGSGNIRVSSPDWINEDNENSDPHSATLVVKDTLTIKTEKIYVYGGADINKLISPNVVYLGTDDSTVTERDRTPEAWLKVGEAYAPKIHAPWMILSKTDGTTDEALVKGADFYYDIKPTMVGSDHSVKADSEYTGKRYIVAKEIADGTTLELRRDNVELLAETMNGTDVTLSDGAAPMVTNMQHSGGIVHLTHSYTDASGTLSADEFIMPVGYTIRAAHLNIKSLVATAGSVSTGTTTFAMTRNTPIENTTYTNVSMKDAIVTASATYASEIKALDKNAGPTTIELRENYVLGSSLATPLAIEIDNLVASDGNSLSNIEMSGNLTTKDNVTINNLTLKSGKFMTLGSATIKNMTLSNVSQFGGENGTSFQAIPGTASMTFDGKLDDTGKGLSLDKVDLDASGFDFGVEGSTVELLQTTDGSISTKNLNGSNVSFNLKPFNDATLETNENGDLCLVGKNNETAIRSELIGNSDMRKETMSAIDEVLGKITDQKDRAELGALYDSMGMVKVSSTEHRRQILDSISGASLSALADSQRRGVQNVQNSLRNRIIQMGGNADWENSGIQAWAQADGGFSTTKSSDDAPGYDYTAWGATVGANIDLAETVTAGMSFSASYGEIESDHADKATGDSNAYYVNLFARHQTGRWTQMLILTAGQNDMTLERTVGSYTAEGDTSGSTFSAYYEVGYTLGLNNEFTHIIQPIVSARITSAKVDGYEEKGSIGNAALSYDGGSYTYGTIAAGFRYQGVMYESVFERNAVLEVRAMVTSDFGDTTDTAKVALGQGKMREVEGVDTSGTGFDFGVGLSIPMEMQTTLFFDADLNMRPDYTGVSANVGLRYDF